MIKYDFNLKGKVAVITGGGGALSGVFAEALYSHGAKVALFDINKEAADKAAAKLEAAGGIAKGYKADVLSKESITEAYEEVKKDFGTCDILLNGAGVHHPLATTEHEQITEENMNDGSRSFFDLDIEKVEWVNRLDFIGTFIPSQVICKDMIGKSGCSVINISSMNAISPTTTVPIYSAAKAGVSNFTACQFLMIKQCKPSIPSLDNMKKAMTSITPLSKTKFNYSSFMMYLAKMLPAMLTKPLPAHFQKTPTKLGHNLMQKVRYTSNELATTPFASLTSLMPSRMIAGPRTVPGR
jgi:NADP-dependent 3-hydroxy acid dehydrogenase YdfG